MDAHAGDMAVPETLQGLRLKLAPFGKPDKWKSIWQVLNTLVPYAALWILLVYMVRHAYAPWTIAATIGVWLFYVQHQFEGVYWTRHADWAPMRAALAGSSYYRLPKVLQWFTGSIGLHHVHHVLPRIPNYNLQRAYDATPILQTVRPLTLRASLGSLRLNLWDEQHRRLVSFRSLRPRAQSSPSGDPYDHGNALPA